MAIQRPSPFTLPFTPSATSAVMSLAFVALLATPALANHHGAAGAHVDTPVEEASAALESAAEKVMAEKTVTADTVTAETMTAETITKETITKETVTKASAATTNATSAAVAPSAGPVRYEAGVHYEELPVPVPTGDASRVEVVEMFSYLCIHCFNFDAAVHEWSSRQDDGVAFTRVPAIFNPTWRMFAQAFYTADALGVSDKTHDALFDAVHTKKQDLRTPEALGSLFKAVAGVEEEAFLKTFNSFSVRSKVQQADSRARQVRLQSVPTLIVNGKYKTNSSLAGTNVGMLQVVDFLVKKEQAAAKAAQATQN